MMTGFGISEDWGPLREQWNEHRKMTRPGGPLDSDRLSVARKYRRLVLYGSPAEHGQALFDVEIDNPDFPELWGALVPVALVRSDMLGTAGIRAGRQDGDAIPGRDGHYTARQILSARPPSIEFQDLGAAMPGLSPRIVLYESLSDPEDVVFAPDMPSPNWPYWEPVALAHIPEGMERDVASGRWLCRSGGQLFDARAVRAGQTPVTVRDLTEFPWARSPEQARTRVIAAAWSWSGFFDKTVKARRHVIFMRPGGRLDTAVYDLNIPFRQPGWLGYDPVALVEGGRFKTGSWGPILPTDAAGHRRLALEVLQGKAESIRVQRLDGPSQADLEKPIAWQRARTRPAFMVGSKVRLRTADDGLHAEDPREVRLAERWNVIYGHMGTGERPVFDIEVVCEGSAVLTPLSLHEYEPLALARGRGLHAGGPDEPWVFRAAGRSYGAGAVLAGEAPGIEVRML